MSALSHSARQEFKACQRKTMYNREIGLELIDESLGRRQGRAMATALEHKDPARASEGYFSTSTDKFPVNDQEKLEIRQVEVLAELAMSHWPNHMRAQTEVEFRDPIAGHGFLDGVITDYERNTSCQIHGENTDNGNVLALDGRNKRGGVRNASPRQGIQDGSQNSIRTLGGGDTEGFVHRSSVSSEELCEPDTFGAGDISRELSAIAPRSNSRERAQDALQVGTRVYGREHNSSKAWSSLSGLQEDAPEGCTCKPKRTGIEVKHLTLGFFWGELHERKLAIDQQVTAYFYAMEKAGTPLDKMLYRIIGKATIKQDGRKKESLDDYAKRLREKVLEEPLKYLKQYELYRSPADLKEFELEAIEMNRQYKAAKRAGVWVKNDQSCTQYGGCAYLPLCLGDAGAEAKYRKRPDKPSLTQAQERILYALNDSFTHSIELPTLAKQASLVGAGCASACRALERRGLVEVSHSLIGGFDEYCLTSAGEEALEAIS